MLEVLFLLVCMHSSCYGLIAFILFFKQKTAYDMRISDWSSDVCSSDLVAELARRFAATRALSQGLAASLSDADASAQSMPDASPAKWHLAHTSWFFETFVLRDHAPGYRLFDDRYPYLFNSYYEAEDRKSTRLNSSH